MLLVQFQFLMYADDTTLHSTILFMIQTTLTEPLSRKTLTPNSHALLLDLPKTVLLINISTTKIDCIPYATETCSIPKNMKYEKYEEI